MTVTLSRQHWLDVLDTIESEPRFRAAHAKITEALREDTREVVGVECLPNGAREVGRYVGGPVGDWIQTQANAVLLTRDEEFPVE